VAIGALATYAAAFTIGANTVPGFAAVSLTAAGAIAAGLLARRGFERIAPFVLLACLWTAGLVILFGSGTDSPANAVFFSTIVAAALVWGARGIAGFGAVSVATGLIVFLTTIDTTAPMVEADRRFAVELTLLVVLTTLSVLWEWRAEVDGSAASQQRRFEQDLSSLYRAVQAARSGLAITDLTGHLRFANAAALEMWGATSERDVIGRSAMDFWADPEEALAVVQQVDRGEDVVAELRAKRLDGTIFPAEISGTRVGDRDSGGLRIASIVDISGRKQAERTLAVAQERTRAIVDHAHDIVLILDGQGTILFENAAVERILGFTPGERVGHPILSYAHPDDLPMATQGLGDVLTEPDRSARVTLRFRHKDGSWRWLETHGRNLLHEPAIGGILGVGRDVTEQRQLQARLEATERLETVGRLAGGLAHDFNNLLTAILGNAELAERTTNAGEILRHLQGIVASAERARELTRKLLGFARMEHSRPSVVDLRKRMLDADDLLRRLLSEDVRLRTDVGDDPLPALIDPVQFEQILLNLAVNARDAMPDGGTFSLIAEQVKVGALSPVFIGAIAPGQAVRILATDTGHGMSADVVARIFEPFFTTKEHGKGTGLGLSTVYGSVVQAGGAIRVQSELRQGTTFEILLPLADLPVEPADTPSQRETNALSGLVVLAEDDSAVRHLMEELLTGAGCEVLTARNGAQGMTLVSRHAQDMALLVTDVVMPDVRGTELAAHFRRLRADGRVIFVTGYSPDTSLSSLATGMKAPILQKPFRVDQFLSEVGRALRGE
jgi:PAS domain S-box-containing protein